MAKKQPIINDVDEAKEFLDISVTPSRLLPILEHLLRRSTPQGQAKTSASVFIWGGPGIGKTDLVRLMATSWGLSLVAIHLPQYDPTDLKGIVVRMEDGSVKWVTSSYLPQMRIFHTDSTITIKKAEHFTNGRDLWVRVLDSSGKEIARHGNAFLGDLHDIEVTITDNPDEYILQAHKGRSITIQVIEKCLLFLDELSAADPSTQNAALQLCLDRRVNEYTLPDGCPIVAAGNRESDGAFVQAMSHPLCNRFCHITLRPSVPDFIQYGLANRVDPTILGFLQAHGDELLYQYKPDAIRDGNCGFPTPRTWTMLSNQLIDIPEEIERPIVIGFLGHATGEFFLTHREVCRQFPNLDDILEGKTIRLLPSIENSRPAMFALVTALCHHLLEYYRTYATTSPEWSKAVASFIKFVEDHVQDETTLYALFMITRVLNIKLTSFYAAPKEFNEFSAKYNHLYKLVAT